MKKIHALLFCCTLLFSSCFEIIEQVQLKDDGSGNLQLTLNLSKSKTRLNSIMKMETINGHPVPTKETITKKVGEIRSVIEKTSGINNVQVSLDFDNYIGVVSFNFLNVLQLNKAIKAVKLKEKATGLALEDNFTYNATSKTFERKNAATLRDAYSSMSKADKEIFSTAGYTAIYKFESAIVTTSNKDAKLSPGKKAVMLSQPVLAIITEKKSIENKINITNK